MSQTLKTMQSVLDKDKEEYNRKIIERDVALRERRYDDAEWTMKRLNCLSSRIDAIEECMRIVRATSPSEIVIP